MRTKALLVGAIIGAASLVSSQAQVYSVNIVGYINVPIYTGWNLIANQLNNSAGNTVGNLIPTPPGSLSVFTYDSVKQEYNNANYIAELSVWDTPELPINPGQGCFILSGSAWTLTLVGEVQTGTSTVNFQTGWNLVSLVVPQDGQLADVGDGSPNFGYVPSPQGDSLFTYDAVKQEYNNYNYLGDPFFMWDTTPTIKVGAGFFALRGAPGTWTRTFNVNN